MPTVLQEAPDLVETKSATPLGVPEPAGSLTVVVGLRHLSYRQVTQRKMSPRFPSMTWPNSFAIHKMKMPDMGAENTAPEVSSRELPDRLPFPPVTYSHILHCSYHDWHPRYAFASLFNFSTKWSNPSSVTAHLSQNHALFL